MSYKKYRDLNLDFTAHPVTGDVPMLNDVDAIKRALRNLIQLNYYEVPFSPEIGSSIRQLLFEQVSSSTGYVLKQLLKNLIETYEPRVEIQDIQVIANLDEAYYWVKIIFNIVNKPEIIEIGIKLNRLR